MTLTNTNEFIAPDRDAFREAMSRLGAAVNIITTTNEKGDAGFTASAVCSVTDTPPTLLVCMNRSSSQYDNFKTAGKLCVNVLAHEGREISAIFAGVRNLPMAERFGCANWIRLKTGCPVLETAAVSMDCLVDQMVEVGTHDVIFCAVQAIHFGPVVSGLIYHARGYHHVGD